MPSTLSHGCSSLLAAALLCLLPGCVEPMPPSPPVAVEESFWNGDYMSGKPSIRISLSQQRAFFYKDGQLAGMSRISSGREGLDTVTGKFKIIEKDIDHVSSLFGDYVDANGNVIQKDVDTSKDPKPKGAIYDGAKMPYFMRIVGGTGMHEGYLPGYAASHGCIRMPGFMAAAFFHAVELGTPVSIEP
ncbi:MAG: L,D-transpeptidase family protein [Prosthecobacter sp.]|uniref:L,D-transpeptidase family protein n=1 Tax=Prosthecobacter sp. TaxID=1965333 RepID=UPI003BB1F551